MVIATMACSLACGVLFQLGIASLVKTDLLIFVRSFWFCFRFFACGCWSPSPECSSRSRHHFPTQHTHAQRCTHRAGGRCGACASIIVQRVSLSFLSPSLQHSGGTQRSTWLLAVSSHGGNAHQCDLQLLLLSTLWVYRASTPPCFQGKHRWP